MSRPDDNITANAGHPGWPRQPDSVMRDPVTGRPISAHQVAAPAPMPEAWAAPPEAWPGQAQAGHAQQAQAGQMSQAHAGYGQPAGQPQAGQQGYHYPGQGQLPGQPPGQPPAGYEAAPAYAQPTAQAPQHYQPAGQPAAQVRTQPAGRVPGAPLADYAPQFARFSGVPEAAPPAQAGYPPEPYQPPRAGYAAAQPQAQTAEQHWPGNRLPYQGVTEGQPRTHEPYAPPADHGHDGGQAAHYAQAQFQPNAAPAYADPQGAYGQGQYGHAAQQPFEQPGYPPIGQPNGAHLGSHHTQYGGQHGPDQGLQAGYDQYGAQFAPQQADGNYGQQYAQGQNAHAPGGYGQDMVFDPGQPIAPPEGGFEPEFQAPARKGRGLLVAGALVCAVAVGGGLAFVYKTFGQSGKRLGPPPVVAKASGPSKIVPADQQGRPMDNANKKVLARMDEAPGGATQTSAPGGPAPIVPGMIVTPPSPPPTGPSMGGGDPAAPATRSVQSVPIGRDGNPVGAQSQAVVTPRGLPGVQIDNSLNGPPPMRGSVATAEPQAAAPAAKPTATRVASVSPNAPMAAPESAEPAAVPGAPVARTKVRAAVPKIQKDPVATLASGSAGGSGFVAVLASAQDPAAALGVFATLAQKFPDQLGGRTPEVQTATVKDKSYQRLVVGPPSSQQSARDLCNQLKAAGHTGDCWVKAY